MAKPKLKASNNENQNVEVNVEVTTPDTENTEEVITGDDSAEDTAGADDTEEVSADETGDNAENSDSPIEVDLTPTVEDSQPKVDVDPEAVTVDTKRKPKENVKIRLRVDHSCTIAMERYDFKEGKVYNVPANVKKILNRAGLLAPL